MLISRFADLKKVLEAKGYSTNVGDEGGFAPNLQSQAEAFICIEEAVNKAGYKFGEDISISLDCAASEFYDKDKKVYKMDGKETKRRRSEEKRDFFIILMEASSETGKKSIF